MLLATVTLNLKKGHYRYCYVCFIPLLYFPFMCSIVRAAPAYMVYISQLKWYYKACGSVAITWLKHCHIYVPSVIGTISPSFPLELHITGLLTLVT